MQRGIAAIGSIGRSIGIVGCTFVASLGGCTADSGDGGILVLKNVLADSMCRTTVSATSAGLSSGSLDLLVRSGYQFIAQMKSRVTALAGQEDQRTILVTGANVDITFPGSTLFNDAELAELEAMALTRRKVLFSAAITPNGGLVDAGFTLIPEQLTSRIRAKVGESDTRVEVLATFTVVGDMSGQEVTSQPFAFPVTMGLGVVINNAGFCPLPKEFGTPRTGYACNVGQDFAVDCCTTDTGLLRCPANVSTM